jgi:hypothetical protein
MAGWPVRLGGGVAHDFGQQVEIGFAAASASGWMGGGDGAAGDHRRDLLECLFEGSDGVVRMRCACK